MLTNNAHWLSDCQFGYKVEMIPELEFSVSLDSQEVLDAVFSAVPTYSSQWRYTGPLKLAIPANVQPIDRQTIMQIEVLLVSPIMTSIRISADRCTKYDTIATHIMKDMNSLKQLIQIECSYRIGESSREWLSRVVHDKSTPELVLRHLSLNTDAEIRIGVADNPSTPLSTLSMLANDMDPMVRYAIAENHNICSSILNGLIHDENPYVACRAAKTLARLDACTPAHQKHRTTENGPGLSVLRSNIRS